MKLHCYFAPNSTNYMYLITALLKYLQAACSISNSSLLSNRASISEKKS